MKDKQCNGDMIKQIRLALGMTQKDFGKMLGQPLQQTVSRWERGVHEPQFNIDQWLLIEQKLSAIGKKISDFR